MACIDIPVIADSKTGYYIMYQHKLETIQCFRTHQVRSNIAYKLCILSPFCVYLRRGWCDQSQPELAIIDPKGVVDVEVKAVV